MKVNVTEEHIKHGNLGDEHSCPIARALLEEFSYVSVRESVIAYRKGGLNNCMTYTISLPLVMYMAIRNYDKTGIMLPFTFEL